MSMRVAYTGTDPVKVDELQPLLVTIIGFGPGMCDTDWFEMNIGIDIENFRKYRY